MTAKGKITTANLLPGETRVLVVHVKNFLTGEMELRPAAKQAGAVVARIISVEAGEKREFETRAPRNVTTSEGVVRAHGHETFILAPATVQFVKSQHVEALAENATRTAPAATVSTSVEEQIENREIRTADAIRGDVEIVTNLSRTAAARLNEAAEAIEKARPEITEERFTVLRDFHNEASRYFMNMEWQNAIDHADAVIENIPKALADTKAERIARLRAEFPAAPEWRKARITAALAEMGAVVFPAGTPEHEEYGQHLTAALSEWKTTGEERFVFTFERIGRRDNPKPLFVACFERDGAIVEKVHAYVAKFLTSREFGLLISFNEERTGGTVEIEGGRYGSGTITREAPPR